MELPSALFRLGPKNFSLKNFLIYFPKKSAPKKFLIFSQKSPKFSGNRNPEKILIFQEMELYYTSENGTFLYFGKSIFRSLAYSEP